MSLYKDNFSINLSKKTKISLLIIIISIILIILTTIFIINIDINIFKSNPINGKFKTNPLILSKSNNSILEINIKNNQEKDVNNTQIEIKNIEKGFNIFCDNSEEGFENIINIEKISKNNKRTLYCDIRVIDKNILEGTYSFDIKYYINNEKYNKRINLEIKK
ncbi:MAG: hypothetical protein PHR26_00025 [Candidatus ainarchaeum sp.]|nr:hypothetical protein [Candidatus ainarchaeum sp.]MDD3976090.1 hypothetical protein [Candidatus ainarchaeum sp.]